ncbi:peptide deformylase [Methylotuvimicrobium sp. KM2]|uniref:peptide deformylase n=1 Tax=Methylotuvimicrobium sp. KM2 TaxID=3133976 RepID=UPI0031014E24
MMNRNMNIRAIEQIGAQVLRRIAMPVERVDDPSVIDVIAAMQATLASTEGVGLAAPQIGESLRIMIVASRSTPRYPKAPTMDPTVMVNPEFNALSNEIAKDWEGCLSIPGIRALVPRFRSISVSYLDDSGARQTQILEGFVARVFQHEYDHLDGLVYLDRVETNRDIVSELEFQKLITECSTA